MSRPGQKAAGIVLAAGASTRMGRLKQLVPIGGETLIERVLSPILRSCLDDVVVVLGCRAQDIEAVIAPRFPDTRLRIVQNPRYLLGMASSLSTGIAEIEHTHTEAMIFLADMPCITAGLIDRLHDAFRASGMRIGAVKGKGRPAHPVIFDRELYGEIKGLTGDMGARSLLHKYRDAVCLIEPEAGYDSLDVDTPEDIARYRLYVRDFYVR